MHSVPIGQKSGARLGCTLLEWCTANIPEGFDLVHRLDFETHGLALFAKNKKSFGYFKSLQNRGEFVKEYSAACGEEPRDCGPVVNAGGSVPIPGFPAPPFLANFPPSPEKPLLIESFFRPFGKGRKQVRPVTDDKRQKEVAKDNGAMYETEIIGMSGNVFTVRIRRGFRHQIRCHLCWIGFPVLNDPLYRHFAKDEPFPASDKLAQRNLAQRNLAQRNLALRARALFFTDPSSGQQREYRIPPLKKTT